MKTLLNASQPGSETTFSSSAPLLALLALASCASPAPDTAPSVDAATVSGHVRVLGQLPGPRVDKLWPDTDATEAAAYLTDRDWVLSDAGGVAHCVVTLDPMGDTPKLPLEPREATMRSEEHGFVPRVLLLTEGSTLNFLNGDDHRTCLDVQAKKNPSTNKLLKAGVAYTQRFENAEVMRVGCDIRPWKKAWLFVTDEPLSVITDANGAFRFDDIPPGRYRVRVWHAQGRDPRPKIDVAPGAELSLEIELTPPPTR